MEITNKCISVANRIINLTKYCIANNNIEINMNVERLQSLLYLIQVEYLTQKGEFLFEDDFYIFQHEIIIPKFYDRYFIYENGAIRPTINLLSKTELDSKEQKVIDEIFELTKYIDNYKLKLMVQDDLYNKIHSEKKSIIKEYTLISKENIKKYYSRNEKFNLKKKLNNK